MDFKEIKNLAINLYRQGKTEEEIKKLCNMSITKEKIANWIQEDEEKDKMKKILKLLKKMKQIKQIELNENNKDEIIEQIQQIAFEILKVDNNNEIAINELVRCYTIQKQYDIGRVYGEKILEINPNNIFVLYNMTKLEIKAGNIEKANKYNSKLLELDSNNKQGNIQKRIIKDIKKSEKKKIKAQKESRGNKQNRRQKLENRKEERRKQRKTEKEIRKTKEQKQLNNISQKKSIEEEQNEFARINIQEEKYTLENQKEYIEELNRMFIKGEINRKNINSIKRELYKYPDKIESSIFLSEIYYAITEQEENGISQLKECMDKAESLSENDYKNLDDKINEFKKRIDLKEYMSKKEEERQIREKELKKEQREYSRQIIQSIDKGEIKKEDIPEIVRKLESYPDRAKAIFLIMKLYEGFYGTIESLKFLSKYSKISNLTQSEIESIMKMENMLLKNRNIDTMKRRQEKVRRRNIERKKYTKKKEKDTKNMIENMLKDGNTVKAIQMKVIKNGDIISIKSITQMKAYLITTDDAMKNRYEQKIEIAKKLTVAGFSDNEIYELLGADVAKNRIAEIRKEQKSKEK